MVRSLSVSVALALLILSAVASPSAWAGKITISAMPAVSSSVLIADDTTPYTVTLTASADAGYNDIRCIRVLFNLTESGSDPNNGRGYLSWGQTDADITIYGGTWVFADANGGGRWAYRTDAWGGDTYITPLACATSTAGSATGGIGTRTVTFTIKAKPAWASNPVINDADAWAMTANDGPNDSDYCKVGWLDNANSFDVLAQACASNAATPSAPIVANPTADTLDVAIHPADSNTDLFAIRISPPVDDATSVVMNYDYLQPDGTVGGFPAWQTKVQWATTTVQGLNSSTSYTFSVRAWNQGAGVCPSLWSPVSTATTAMREHAVSFFAAGTPIHKGVHGMDAQAKYAETGGAFRDTLAASFNTSMRNGGDGYNWKTRTALWNSTTTSTLKYLRLARDRNSFLQILTNTRGIGTGNGSTWVYTDQSATTLAALTADWVYYCNKLIQTKRQGDTLASREQAILDSMDWGTDDKLLAPGEAMVPRVDYWEIGNEPEGPYPPPSLTPSDYAYRYRIISAAMLTEDPTIKIGPGCMTADNGNAWLDAVFADTRNRVDFVAYHPYGNLYGITRDNSGGSLNANNIMKGLNVQKNAQVNKKQKIIERLVVNNRPADTELSLSEWNTSSWQGTYYYGLGQTVAQGLGTAEDIFSFIEMGIVTAHYWDQPNIPNNASVPVPCFLVFQALQTYLKGNLLDSLNDGYLRIYTTKDPDTDQIILWAINLSETADTPIHIQLQDLPRATNAITQRKLAAFTGETSLITRNYGTQYVGWTETDLTGQIDPADFTMTFDNATLTMIILDFPPTVQADLDRDGDVDLEDFGRFQLCLTGPETPQTDEACAGAKLNNDNYVDLSDMQIFMQCKTGPGIPPDLNCAN